MTAALVHRGPDAGAVASLDGGATFGHRRLAVIDLDRAADQPMADSATGACLVFNGEIYNYRALRKELEEDGIRFRTDGDTEVLLKGLVRHGEKWIDRLLGMFAFAFWDPATRRLMLVRDRLGKKPLYFQETPEGVAFASELTALRRAGAVSGEIDPAAVTAYLAAGYLPTGRCIVAGAEKVKPASIVRFSEKHGRAEALYWDLAGFYRNKGRWRDIGEAADAIGELLDDSVAQRLVSDVPIGSLLSGGVDSAAVTESMVRALPGNRIQTFTMDFDRADHSEREAAAETARALNVDNTVGTLDDEVLSGFAEICRFADEPFADTSMLPTYHLARMARRKMTVALSGDGGDELFAGYVTNIANVLYRQTALVPVPVAHTLRRLARAALRPSFGKVGLDYKIDRFLGAYGLDHARAHCHWRGIFDPADRRALLRPEHTDALNHDPFDDIAAYFEDVRDLPPLEQASYVDFKTWLADDILVKVDRMSMAHALEVRVPLLDHRLAELAAGLPMRWKFKLFRGKRVLRHHLRRRLPPAVLARRKAGFNAPVSHWFAARFRDQMRDLTTTGAVENWFDKSFIETLWREHLGGRRDNGYRLFTLACFAQWLETDADPAAYGAGADGTLLKHALNTV